MSDLDVIRAKDPLDVLKVTIASALRRRLLHAARDFSDVQELLDCADLAEAAGLPGGAAKLRTLARLHLGLAPRSDRKQVSGGASSFEARVRSAVNELKPMLALTRELGPLDVHGPKMAAAYMSAICSADTVPNLYDGQRNAIDALFDALRAPLEAGTVTSLRALLDQFEATLLRGPSPDLNACADVTPERLIELFAAGSLQQFLRTRHFFAHPPFGSAELFHVAARLDPAGLGPFCANARRLVRDTIDLLALLEATGHPLELDEQDRWLTLFATCMRGRRLYELVEDLADLGRMRPIWGIFTTALRSGIGSVTVLDRELLLSIRDAALDNGEMRLAIDAQRIIASRINDTRLEWRILGDILATAGHDQPAAAAYEEGLRIAPGDAEISLRLNAMHSGLFEPFAVRSGYSARSARRGVRQPRRKDLDS